MSNTTKEQRELAISRASGQVASMPFGMQRAASKLTPAQLQSSADHLQRQAEDRRWLADYMEAVGIESMSAWTCQETLKGRPR